MDRQAARELGLPVSPFAFHRRARRTDAPFTEPAEGKGKRKRDPEKDHDRRLYGHAPFTALLIVSTAAILALGIYTIVLTLGIYRVG